MDIDKIFISAIIPAAGQGRRMNASMNKQFLKLKGKPILYYTLDAFERCSLVDEIILVVCKDEEFYCLNNIINFYKFKKVKIAYGGSTRQQSVYSGLLSVSSKCKLVIVHDGARPLIGQTIIEKGISEALKYKAAIVAVPAKNTIKMVRGDGFVEYTPNREKMVEVQTPQTFDYHLLKNAHEKAIEERITGTDDAFLIEWIGKPVKIVRGHYNNIKITTPEDLLIAESMIDLYRNEF